MHVQLVSPRHSVLPYRILTRPILCSGYNDVKSFVNLAGKIETIGASTYLGLARHINDTSLLNVGAVSSSLFLCV